MNSFYLPVHVLIMVKCAYQGVLLGGTFSKTGILRVQSPKTWVSSRLMHLTLSGPKRWETDNCQVPTYKL
jgi:hypothetical protein